LNFLEGRSLFPLNGAGASSYIAIERLGCPFQIAAAADEQGALSLVYW
jgi:hypothetical protein